MFKVLLIAFAFGLAAVAAPAVAKAAAQADRCAARPGDVRRQCFIKLGATCEPATGRLWLRGPSGGAILGEVRRDSRRVSRKSADKDAAEPALYRDARIFAM